MQQKQAKKPVTWGSSDKKKKKSPFFKGINIIQQLVNSSFGKIKQTFEEIFCGDDVSDYRLPKVIVIGNESTGKSSLLENITKCQIFPRDSKICTKCPIHLKLSNSPSAICSIAFNGNKEESCDKHDIYEKIINIMKSIPDDDISEDEIVVKISDVNLPTFEFYDLPGIRAYPQKSFETTTKLCRKYLQDKNSIVLCVVPATITRLTSCQSIALIQEMHMEPNTILALTMIDRLQLENIEELLIKRILKTSDEVIDLTFAGIVAVVNRLHVDVVSLSENDDVENKWFEKNIVSCIPDEYMDYADDIKESTTVNNLISKIDDLYDEFIKKDWKPRILTMIDCKIDVLTKQLEKLGKPPNELDFSEITRIIQDHIKNYKFGAKSIVYPSCNGLSDKFSDIYADYYIITNWIMEMIELFNNTDNKFIVDFITHISLFFDDKTDLKMERFSSIKKSIVSNMYKKYGLNLKDNLPSIKQRLIYFVEMSMTHNSIATQHSIITMLETLFITFMMQPLKTLPLLKIEDFIENEEYSQKRKDLEMRLEKAKLHRVKIETLGNDE